MSNIAAIIGLSLCLVSGLVRLNGAFFLFKTYQVGTVFLLGVGIVSVVALVKVYTLDCKRLG